MRKRLMFETAVLGFGCLVVGGLATGCKHQPAALPGITPLETAVNEAFAAIDAGDAHQLYSLTSTKERNEEALTEDKLAKLLAIFRNETQGATHGAIVVGGGDGLVSGDATYRIGTKTLTSLNLNSRPDDSGRPTVNVVTGLVQAAMQAHGSSAKSEDPNSIFLEMISGLQALKPQFEAAGIDRIYRGGNSAEGVSVKNATVTFDQELARLKMVLEIKRARATKN